MIGRASRAAAAADAGAAVVPEGQPGRPAGAASSCCARRRCRCRCSTSIAQIDHRPAHLDGQRRRAGQRLRLAEVRGARRRRPARAGGHGRSASTKSPPRSRTPTSTCRPARSTATTDVRRAGQRPAAARRRPTARRSSPTATATRCGWTRSRTSTTASRTTRRRAGTNGERCIYLSIQKQPGTNVVAVVDAVKALLPTFREQLPAVGARSTSAAIARSPIRESVHDVKLTLLLTIVPGRRWSSSCSCGTSRPRSSRAWRCRSRSSRTFAVMYLLGYSLDNLSLMALTLSVGFVVDDAIVMLENIVRHMEMGKTPMQAALRRLEGDRASRSLSMTRVAGRGVHPGAVHGRHRRPAAARVRGDDRRRDPGVGLRLDQPDADAVQPLPEAAARAAARPALQRDRADVRRLAAALRRARCASACATAR